MHGASFSVDSKPKCDLYSSTTQSPISVIVHDTRLFGKITYKHRHSNALFFSSAFIISAFSTPQLVADVIVSSVIWHFKHRFYLSSIIHASHGCLYQSCGYPAHTLVKWQFKKGFSHSNKLVIKLHRPTLATISSLDLMGLWEVSIQPVLVRENRRWTLLLATWKWESVDMGKKHTC